MNPQQHFSFRGIYQHLFLLGTEITISYILLENFRILMVGIVV
nr:MAG TPA: hypothetical protein [Caudoviricetes sp.]